MKAHYLLITTLEAVFTLWVKIFPCHHVAYRANSLLLCEYASDLTFQFTLLPSTDVFTPVTLNQLLCLSLGHTLLSSFIFACEECPLYLECPFNPYLGNFHSSCATWSGTYADAWLMEATQQIWNEFKFHLLCETFFISLAVCLSCATACYTHCH